VIAPNSANPDVIVPTAVQPVFSPIANSSPPQKAGRSGRAATARKGNPVVSIVKPILADAIVGKPANHPSSKPASSLEISGLECQQNASFPRRPPAILLPGSDVES
jgi:hypothetical protein